jgi:hypothetical protein
LRGRLKSNVQNNPRNQSLSQRLPQINEVVEIAIRVANWSNFDVDEASAMELVRRVRTAWAANGIGFHSRFEAMPMVSSKVSEGMPRLAIFMKAPLKQHPGVLS